MNFCLKRQHCFVCAVLLFISLKKKSLIIFQKFFLCHAFYIQMGDQTVGLMFIPVLHPLRKSGWFLELRSEWLSSESSTNVQCLMPCTHKPSQLTIPRCCCLGWAVPPRQICIPLHCILHSCPGLEMLPLFGVLHVQLMFFIINASQNLQSAPDLHIKETH